jgi:regulatory protein
VPNETSHVVIAIGEHPTRHGRYVVSVDGSEIATVTAETLAAHHIRVGRPIDSKTIDALQNEHRRTLVLDRALRLLAVRARTTTELRQSLLRAKDRPAADDVKWVITTLTERGYLDDARFADQFVRDRAASRGWAKHRLRQELRKRGVDQTRIEPALTQADDDAAIDDDSAAAVAAAKWRRTHSARDPQKDRQRLYGFLARRGFSPDVIRSAMQAVLDDGGEGAESP